MKKLLLLLTGILMSCSVYAYHSRYHVFTKTLLPSDMAFEYVIPKWYDLACWFQTGGDTIPVSITLSNSQKNTFAPEPSNKAGIYTIHHPGATRLLFSGYPIDDTYNTRITFQNADYNASSQQGSVLIIDCWRYSY